MLNWNQLQLTIDCLESLYKMNYRDFEVILVDNGSTDDSADKIAERFPQIKIIRNKENLGFTGGNNVGIKEVIKSKPEYIMLLNNDTVVHEDMLSELVKGIEADENIGMVGPKIYYEGGRTIWSAGVRFDRLLKRNIHVGYRDVDKGQYSKTKDVDMLTMCAVLIRRTVIEKIGFLNDKFFRIAEDMEYSMRMKRAGFRLVFVPGSILWHKVSSSSGGENAPPNTYYLVRNMLYLDAQYFKLSVPLMVIKYLVKAIYLLLVLRWELARAMFYGVVDFLIRKTGRSSKY